MLYLGPIYPRKWGPIEISHFLPPLGPLQNHDFIQLLHVFKPTFGDNSVICWSILMQDTVLKRLLVVNSMTAIWI
jgi:hypothetical protein